MPLWYEPGAAGKKPSPARMRVLSHHGWFHGVFLSAAPGSFLIIK
jgi:hypothetical protein